MAVAKKKIIWLAHEGNLSGANIALLEYVEALRKEFDFHIILPHEGNMRKALQERNIALSVIPQYGWAGTLKYRNAKTWLKIMVRSFIALQQTKRLFKNEKANLVFTNTQVPFIAARAAYACKLPHIWWIHEYGEEDFGFKIGWGDTEMAYKKIIKWSDVVICNSEDIARKFRSKLPGTKVERLYQPVTYIGGSMSKLKKAQYLMFGQIIASKGHLEVLEAIRINRDRKNTEISLSITGPCEDENYLALLNDYITTYNLQDRVSVTVGFFKKVEVLPMYDTLIVASRCEAFGRVIVEANKAGLSVIVKNAGGAPELINTTNGKLYTTVEELAELLIQAHSFSPQEYIPAYDEQEEITRLKKLLSIY